MTYSILISARMVLSALATAQLSMPLPQSFPIESVRGVMVLHWEYPHFVRQDGPKERVFEIDIRDEKWRTKHFDTLPPEITRDTPSFCVTAEGYEDRSRLGPTDRTTFVFTVIKSTKLVQSEDECEQSARKP
ncbi:hypothetical protein [Sphingomonas sp.]|uniref:hypothetical protein n=1 Tax=Sphingomonas sp. TaxID=28214 RepID=UPI0031D54C6D